MNDRAHLRGLFFVLACFPLALPCRAIDATPLRSLRAVANLSNEEASKALPVAFTGTVTFYRHDNVDLFVQEGDAAIYVEASPDYNFSTGDRVLVIGTTRASFRPEIKGERIVDLGHGTIPKPVRAEFGRLIRAELDCHRATVRGTVRSANMVLDGAVQFLYLQILMEGGAVDAEIAHSDKADLPGLLDSEVEITGAVAGKFDSKNQMTGVLIEVESLSDVRVLKHASISPRSLAFTPMDEILRTYSVENRTQRVRVDGTITYYQPGAGAVLQNGDKSLWLKTQYEQPIRIGDWAEATGFADVQNGSLILTSTEIYNTPSRSKVTPFYAAASDLSLGGHAFDLVSTEGQLLMAVREAAQDEYVLVSNGQLFSAILKHPEPGQNQALAPMKTIPVGSNVRITGICVPGNGDKNQEVVAFDMLLRSPEDLIAIKGPSLFSVRNLSYLIGVLLVILSIVGLHAWRMERRNRRQNARMAWMEQKRSRILEEINGNRPLNEIIEEITEMVSFRCLGAPCWCELKDGSVLGNHLQSFAELRTAEVEIQSRADVILGRISAAFHVATKPTTEEWRTLSMAAGLIALAIENRRLYSDLQRRSEFDLLTNVCNRFSFERHLAELIEHSGKENKVFGIIYIDLDGFKLINDTYGHQVGDRFLQEVSLRLKHQLRPGDMIARLGGDEFAIAIDTMERPEELHAIIDRLRTCFTAPFSIDGNTVTGAASLGFALYPVDGNTVDSLLNSADAAMYVEKHTRRTSERHISSVDQVVRPFD